jgi:hypothetical protein
MKKIVKLSSSDINIIVDKIVTESKNRKTNEGLNKPERGRTIRLTESEMVEFLDNLSTKLEISRRRRGIK